MAAVIEVRGITKRFPGVVANENIDFNLEAGEIHAMLGENGAGKTTLMNVIYSLYQPDEGEILVNGEVVHFHNPGDAIRLGIGMVHQHFMLVPVMTVTENIMLGVEETTGRPFVSVSLAALIGATLGLLFDGPLGLIFWLAAASLFLLPVVKNLRWRIGATTRGALMGMALGMIYELVRYPVFHLPILFLMWGPIGAVVGALASLTWLDKQTVARRISQISQDFGLEISPHAHIQDLPVGAQQRVEIVKALYRNAKILILDEPTAVLTPQEADDLFKIMRRLTQQGVSIVFITHKLREVLDVADRITVLRRGRVVGTLTPDQATQESLANMMVGRTVLLQVQKNEAAPREIVLRVDRLTVEDDRHHQAVNNASFEVRAGEIVGIAGVQGNGQTELVDAMTGLRTHKAGQITLLGHTATGSLTPRQVSDLGVAYIPEDRHKYGLVLGYSVADNLILCDYYHAPFSNGLILNAPGIRANAERLVAAFDIRTPGIFVPASKLSGGNQQKIIVARELARKPGLLIANQPTRGLDVGSIEFIHNQIVKARDEGAGVLLISAELDEIMALSDRILVMYRGQLTSSLAGENATREMLGLLMAGIQPATVANP